MGVKDYDLNPDNNTQINGINIAEGCPPSGINNAIRQLMADVKNFSETPASAEELGPVKVGDGLNMGEDGTLSLDLVDAVDSTSTTQAATANAVKTAYNKAVKAEAALPAGFVIPFAANSVPSGYLLCNGAAVSRTTYANLFAAIGTTYGKGDGSTTFNLPNLTDRFIQGSGTAGTVKAAGLPDIVGDAGLTFSDANVGGAFYLNGILDSWNGTIQGGNRKYLDFDASRSNSIYGNSDTVQPPALTMRYYIKY